jgi:hypothetical protein
VHVIKNHGVFTRQSKHCHFPVHAQRTQGVDSLTSVTSPIDTVYYVVLFAFAESSAIL